MKLWAEKQGSVQSSDGGPARRTGAALRRLSSPQQPPDESGPLVGNDAFTATGHIMTFAPP